MAPRTQKVQCAFCLKEFSAQGIGSHTKACQKKVPTAAGQSALNNAMNLMHTQEIGRGLALSHAVAAMSTSQPRVVAESSQVPEDSIPSIPLGVAGPSMDHQDSVPDALPWEGNDCELQSNFPDQTTPLASGSGTIEAPVIDNSQSTDNSRPNILQVFNDAINLALNSTRKDDHFTIDFHPSAAKPQKKILMGEYLPLSYHNTKESTGPPTVDRKPWAPFRTRLDFEVAELALSTHMNREQTNTLFALLEKCAESPKDLTLRSATDLEKVWAAARTCHATSFTKKKYEAQYKGNSIPYEIYIRPLDDWCRSLLLDPFLLPKFRWNAERHFKVHLNGHKERVISEPWTANAWWKIQDRLPQGALPFCIILYADKTRLSTFGTAKAYPIIARCANLPCDIRNGSGVGGGMLVGWLPIVEEDAGETGKKVFINFKRVVWHKGFYELLLTIQSYDVTGCRIQCADEILRWFFFFILILSADYEEQCVMALIRGSTGNFPCPVCLVPREELGDLTKTYRLRSVKEMQTIYKESQNLNATNRDKYLKDVGLRDVENVFWMMNGSDVYNAISWDRLHAYHGGLFSDHLWSEFKSVIDKLGKPQADLVDKQFDLVPRWAGLNHFSSVIKTGEFADGSKYEDMGKLIVFSSHNVLASDDTGRGYCLLKLMRSFVELDMYSSLTVHTDTTVAGLSAELLNFGVLLEEYIGLYEEKNWNFPKNHSHIHMVRDILEKGVTRNSNTKPNEKAHGLLKLWYRFHTNFKDVAPQILKLNEQDLIAMLIRMAIDFLDETDAAALPKDAGIPETATAPILDTKMVSIGSMSKEISLQDFQNENGGDRAFDRFRTKLGQYLARLFNQHIRLHADHKITLYHLLRVRYQSLIDWTTQRDLLRVSPSFHGQRRNDWVLIKANNKEYVIGQLLTIFTITLGDITHTLAHILPFDGTVDQRTSLARTRDKDLRFIRVRVRRRVESVIVDVQCIERGCLLVQDHGNDGNDFIVIDVTDQDMWWRFKVRKLAKNVRL